MNYKNFIKALDLRGQRSTTRIWRSGTMIPSNTGKSKIGWNMTMLTPCTCGAPRISTFRYLQRLDYRLLDMRTTHIASMPPRTAYEGFHVSGFYCSESPKTRENPTKSYLNLVDQSQKGDISFSPSMRRPAIWNSIVLRELWIWVNLLSLDVTVLSVTHGLVNT